MKLYWRYKKDGKWTWKPATIWTEGSPFTPDDASIAVCKEEEE